jgi:hypothetical protein
MREVNGSELLDGSDHEFVVNLYTMVLNRWPDEEGYRHHLQKVENRPDIRRQVIRDVAASEEGRSLGVVLRFDDEAPPAPAPAPGAAAAAPAAGGDLAATLAALKGGLAAMDAASLATAQALLADALAAVAAQRAERIEARLAQLEQRLG